MIYNRGRMKLKTKVQHFLSSILLLPTLLLLPLPATVSLAAQTLTLSAVPPTIKVGTSTTVTITLTSSGTPIVGLQYQLSAGGFAGAALSPAVASPSTVTAGKSVQCNGSLLCILFGVSPAPANVVSNNPLVSGPLITHQLTVSGASARPGTLTLSLTNALAADASAGPVLIANASTIITVTPSQFDVNADGVVDFSDVLAAVSQALGTCGTADVNVDGKCNIVDIGLIIRAALGL